MVIIVIPLETHVNVFLKPKVFVEGGVMRRGGGGVFGPAGGGVA